MKTEKVAYKDLKVGDQIMDGEGVIVKIVGLELSNIKCGSFFLGECDNVAEFIFEDNTGKYKRGHKVLQSILNINYPMFTKVCDGGNKMTKSILISIKPEWVCKILNGEKTIEIRKTIPKCKLPVDVYIYCCKNKDLFVNTEFVDDAWGKDFITEYILGKNRTTGTSLLNGKVVAKFTLKKVEVISPDFGDIDKNIKDIKLCKNACLKMLDLLTYLNEKVGYAWHIDDLVIFDEPKELSEFKKNGYLTYDQWLYGLYPNTHCSYETWVKKYELTKAPQSWCYVDVKE